MTPWTGAWFADVDFDLDVTQIMPTGQVVLTVGSTPLIGTIDPRGSGRFGTKGHARVVAGAGGWDKSVAAKHFHSEAGLLSALVRTATAAEVGEKIIEAVPSNLGKDFVRTAGPASRVLAGVDWYVNQVGATIVGPRPPLAASPLVDVLTWDAAGQRAELASDELVLPGTVLVDTRFESATVRDVEQTFDENGARATAWCGPKPSGSRLTGALASFVREVADVAHLKVYKYRVIVEGVDERLTLQAVNPSAGVPDVLPIAMWPGMSGLGAKLKPGTIVLLTFIAGGPGDPPEPVVFAFEAKGRPLVFEIDAEAVTIGAAPTSPLALSVAVVEALIAIEAWIAAVTLAAATPPTSTTFTLFGAALAPLGSTVAALLATAIPLVPSKKVVSE